MPTITYLSYYSAKLKLVIEELRRLLRLRSRNTISLVDDVITKYERSSTIEPTSLLPDRATQLSNHLFSIVGHMIVFVEESSSLISKARILLRIGTEIELALRLYHKEVAGDNFLQFVVDIIPFFDCSMLTHIKMLDDFVQLTSWECNSEVSYIITTMLIAYNSWMQNIDTQPLTTSDTVEPLSRSPSSATKQTPTIEDNNMTSTIHETAEYANGNNNNLMQAKDPNVANGSSNNLTDEGRNEIEKRRLLHRAHVALKSFKLEQREWNKTRLDCIENLKELADRVRKTVSNTNIANITGSAVGIVSGVTAIVGIVLIPVTAGLSTILIAGSAVAGGAGGLTGLGSFIVRKVMNSKQQKELNQLSDRDKEHSQQLSDALGVLLECDQQIMTHHAAIEFAQRRLTLQNKDMEDALVINGVSTASTVTKAARTALVPLKALPLFRVVGTAAFEAAGGALSALRVAGIAFAGAFVAVDIFSMVVSAVEMHKGNKTELYYAIIGIIEYLEMERLYYATLVDRAHRR
jgi:hypothetical protein